MKITHCLLDTAHGPLSFDDLRAGGRGVTGSEQAMLYLAREQSTAGHQVSCYLPIQNPGFQEGVELLDVKSAWPRLRRVGTADAVISWLTADFLRGCSSKQVRIHSLQINDWLPSTVAHEEFTDLYVAVSEAHRGHLMATAGHPPETSRWAVIPNGTPMSRSSGVGPRIPRRCVYLSSPDRGLHWILAMWPEIRFAYPDAELHVFYEVQQWLQSAILLNSEVGTRGRYVAGRIPELARHGVILRGAVAPAILAEELSKADLMLYPCDPVRFTEGFGVAALDACAAGVVPMLTDADALGEVYGESGAVVVPRGRGSHWTDTFLRSAIEYLHPSADEKKAEIRQHVRRFAEHFDWSVVSATWQAAIDREAQEKGA